MPSQTLVNVRVCGRESVIQFVSVAVTDALSCSLVCFALDGISVQKKKLISSFTDQELVSGEAPLYEHNV